MTDITQQFDDDSLAAEIMRAMREAVRDINHEFQEKARANRVKDEQRAKNRRKLGGWLMAGTMLSADAAILHNVFTQAGAHSSVAYQESETRTYADGTQVVARAITADALYDVFDAAKNADDPDVQAMRSTLRSTLRVGDRDLMAQGMLKKIYEERPDIITHYLKGVADLIRTKHDGDADALPKDTIQNILVIYRGYAPSENYKDWDHARRNLVLDQTEGDYSLVNARNLWGMQGLEFRKAAVARYMMLRTQALNADGLMLGEPSISIEDIENSSTMAHFYEMNGTPVIGMRAAGRAYEDDRKSYGLLDFGYESTIEFAAHEYDHYELSYFKNNREDPAVIAYLKKHNIEADVDLLIAAWDVRPLYGADSKGNELPGYRINLIETDAFKGMGDAAHVGVGFAQATGYEHYEDGLVRVNNMFTIVTALRPGYKIEPNPENVTFGLRGTIGLQPAAVTPDVKAPTPMQRRPFN